MQDFRLDISLNVEIFSFSYFWVGAKSFCSHGSYCHEFFWSAATCLTEETPDLGPVYFAEHSKLCFLCT